MLIPQQVLFLLSGKSEMLLLQIWTYAGATSYTLDISDTPLNITEDTEIRRLTFAT